MSKAGHFHAPSKSRVLVFMENGEKLVRRFKETKGGWIYFYDGARLATKDVRTLSHYRKTPKRPA